MTDVLLEMMKVYGLKEIPGEENNTEILSMFASIGYDWVQDDETAWCSASLNYFCFKLGYERSHKLDARSWLSVGDAITEPSIGDVVVFWRISPSDWRGHVGLFIREDGDNIWTLGGNQNNMMCIAPYPKERVLGYRRSKKVAYFKSVRDMPITKKIELPPVKVNIISLWRTYRRIKKWLRKHKLQNHVSNENLAGDIR